MLHSARPRIGTAVQLFVTCIIEHVKPQVGLAAVRVLERLGLEVQVPSGQTCCGQPAFNAGARDDARQMARHTIDVLSRSNLPVVIASGTSPDMSAPQSAGHLAGDADYAPRATAVAARVLEFSQAIASLDPIVGRAAVSAPVTYHPSCHLLRGLDVREEPVRLLDAAVGDARVALPGAEDCCGFGGLFSIKMSGISGAMLTRKLDHVRSTGAKTLVACDSSCLMHLEGGMRKRGEATEVRHLAEVLDGCATMTRSGEPGARE
jgi:L-lactate dehydrogenase complex protein LldE